MAGCEELVSSNSRGSVDGGGARALVFAGKKTKNKIRELNKKLIRMTITMLEKMPTV